MESSTIFYLHIKLAFSGSGPFSEDWGEADAWMRSGVGDVLVAALHLGFRETLDLSELLLRTLYCGETVVVHCIAGRHRAGEGASAVMRAALMDESFEVASRWISARRNTDIPGFCKDKAVAQWCQETVVATNGGTAGLNLRDTWRRRGALCTSRVSRASHFASVTRRRTKPTVCRNLCSRRIGLRQRLGCALGAEDVLVAVQRHGCQEMQDLSEPCE